MINEKDVIRMKVPFPDIESTLAVVAHMYVCINQGTEKGLIKCQTLKPYHIISGSKPNNRVIEKPNISRNPFNKESIIDCDKKFLVKSVQLPLSMRTDIRPDISEDLFNVISAQIQHPELEIHNLNTEDILKLNYKATSLTIK